MVFKIKIDFRENMSVIMPYETEKERNAAFQTIFTANWNNILLIQRENNGQKCDIIINLPQVCMVSCVNER